MQNTSDSKEIQQQMPSTEEFLQQGPANCIDTVKKNRKIFRKCLMEALEKDDNISHHSLHGSAEKIYEDFTSIKKYKTPKKGELFSRTLYGVLIFGFYIQDKIAILIYGINTDKFFKHTLASCNISDEKIVKFESSMDYFVQKK